MAKKQDSLDYIGTLFKPKSKLVLDSTDDLWVVFGKNLAKYARSSFNFIIFINILSNQRPRMTSGCFFV